MNNTANIVIFIDFLSNNLSGNLIIRSEEIINATEAFTKLLININKFLPQT